MRWDRVIEKKQKGVQREEREAMEVIETEKRNRSQRKREGGRECPV